MSRYAPFAATVLLLALNAISQVAAAQKARSITVSLTEYKFTPNTITLTVGQPVQLNIQNQGGQDHSLLSSILVTQVHYQKADNTRAELQSYEANSVINADAGSGHTSVVTFTPTKAGTFEFDSEDEESLGLVGNFVVVGPGGQTAAPAASSAPAASNTTVARDGQTLASQSTATQAMFSAVWGDRGAQEWAQEHNAALSRWLTLRRISMPPCETRFGCCSDAIGPSRPRLGERNRGGELSLSFRRGSLSQRARQCVRSMEMSLFLLRMRIAESRISPMGRGDRSSGDGHRYIDVGAHSPCVTCTRWAESIRTRTSESF